MERKKIVIDASIVVKWFVKEEFSEEAKLLRDAYVNGFIDLVALSLLYYEVLNALRYSGAFGEEELKGITIALDDFQIELYNLTNDLVLKTIEIAMRKGLTIYDASYVALVLNTILYTADSELTKKTREVFVKHISQIDMDLLKS